MASSPPPQVGQILDALAELLGQAAETQQAAGDPESSLRAHAARETARIVRDIRAELPEATSARRDAKAIQRWRTMLNRSLTHARLPHD